MQVRFFGVRGSVASSGAHVARTGGNTACVEVTSQGERLIFDAGTGLRALGDELLRAGGPTRATLLFSHLHWDHVQGFPFFGPAWHPQSALTLYGPGQDGDVQLRAALARQMEPPNFPVPLAAMKARLDFRAAVDHRPFEVGPFRVTPFEVPHPNGCVAYHVTADGQTFVYMTDVEIEADTLAPKVASLIAGADAIALDAQYTEREYEGVGTVCRKGWGHSTNLAAARVAAQAHVRRLFLFHHDPAHNDEVVEGMAEEARRTFAATEPAREGARVELVG